MNPIAVTLIALLVATLAAAEPLPVICVTVAHIGTP
jgi:hypothetical protein